MCLVTVKFLTLLVHQDSWGLLFLQYFYWNISCYRNVYVCVLCCCFWCDGKPIYCRSSYGDVRPLSFLIQEVVICLLWKATRRRLSVVQKYRDVKIVWASGTNTKTQSITLVVHTFCVLMFICVCDFSVCGCVYWQPWPFWSELYATGKDRNAQRGLYILNVLGLWVILTAFFF